MRIIKTNVFEALKTENTENITPKIVIKHSTLNHSIQVFGKVLEAQYSVDDNYLLFITEGNPLEEALYIYLLDNRLNIKDSLELSAEYASGIFDNSLIVGLDSIKFSFFEKDDNWMLTVFDNPKISFFDIKHPVKRRSSLLKRNWLQLNNP